MEKFFEQFEQIVDRVKKNYEDSGSELNAHDESLIRSGMAYGLMAAARGLLTLPLDSILYKEKNNEQ